MHKMIGCRVAAYLQDLHRHHVSAQALAKRSAEERSVRVARALYCVM